MPDLAKMTDEEVKNTDFEKLFKKAEQKKLTKWKNEPKLSELKEDFEGAKQGRSPYMSKLENWTNLYDAPKHGDPKAKRSRVAPKLIRKQVEWRCPALSEPFLSTNNLYEVKPLTFEDVPRAKQNSLVLNRQFNTQLDKVNLVDKIIRRVVKDGTAIVRLGWKFKEAKVTETVPEFQFYPVEDEETMEQLAQQFDELARLQVEEPDSYSQMPEELLAAFEMSQESGEILIADQIGEREVETMKTIVNQPTAELCDIRNVYIDPTCKGKIDDAQFIVYSYETSLSDLKKDGNYTNLDDVENLENMNTSLDHSSTDVSNNFTFKDTARKKLIVYEYWGYRDLDNSGETAAFMASWIGDTIIRMEDNPYPDGKPPFVIFNYIPEEESVYGIPDAELLGDNQEILGAVTRGVIDIMGKSANAQTGYSKNFLDATNQTRFRNGEDYLFNPGFDPRVHMHTHTFSEIPNSALTMIQLMNNEAESMSGVKAFSQEGLSAVNFGNTATGVRGVLDAVSKREMSVLRRISEGFIVMGRKIISMNSEFMSEEETIRVTNSEFVTVRRDDLAGEFDLTLTISTAEADDAKAQELAFMLQTMGESMGQDVMRLILAEIATLRKMPDLAKAIEEYAPEPDPIQQQMAETELAKAQAEVALLEAEAAEVQAKAAVYQAKIAVEEARAKTLEGQAGKTALDVVERSNGITHNQEMEKQRSAQEAQLERDALKNEAAKQQMADQHNYGLLNKAAEQELDFGAENLEGDGLASMNLPESPFM